MGVGLGLYAVSRVPGWAATFELAAEVMLLLIALGALLALDLCRRSAVAENGIARAMIFVFCVLTMPLAFPPLGFAWFVWRIARRRVRTEAEEYERLAMGVHVSAE